MGNIVLFLAMYLLIVSHELGHFIAAKALKLEVLRFDVGMLHIHAFRIRETTFRIGLLPIAGAVGLKERHPKLYGKLIVTLAGPIASILFGAMLLVASGVPVVKAAEASLLLPVTVIGDVVTNPGTFVITKDHNNLTVAQEVAKELEFNVVRTLRVLGIISSALAGLNLLPIPPLDGGVATFDILETLFGKKKFTIMEFSFSIVNTIKIAIMMFVLCYFLYMFVAEIRFALFR